MDLISLIFILNVQESDICQAARIHLVDCKTLNQIIAVESNYKTYAFNKKSLDYGIGQIHYKTAMAYKMDIPRLMSDRAYNLERSAFLLASYKKRYAKKEPSTWACRYHIGTGNLEKLEDRCNMYLKKMKAVK